MLKDQALTDAVSAEQALWQTLAAAFLPPMEPAVVQAFTEVLADDLAAFAQEMQMDVAAALHDLRCHASVFSDPAALLLEYSRLFLPPAGKATLNLSRYVDSGVGGACMDAIELAYQAHGLEPSERLRDFADHAARQFECMAWLTARSDGSAAEFANLCLVGALPRLAHQLAGMAPSSPYTALAQLATVAAQCYGATPAQPAAGRRPNLRHDVARGVWRHCSSCDTPFAREKEISIMAKALENAGLPAEHLGQCPACRDKAQGFFRREIA